MEAFLKVFSFGSSYPSYRDLPAYQVCPAALGFASCYITWAPRTFLSDVTEENVLPLSSFLLMDSGLYQSLLCLKLWKLAACPEGP